MFFHQAKYCSLLFLLLEKNILSVLFLLHYFQMIKQKNYSLPYNLGQLSNLSIDLDPALILSIVICSS